MKQKFTLYLLIVVFLMSAMYKTWVWIDFVLNRQYIETNLCINRFDKIPVCRGACYLDKQVKKVDKQEQKFPELKVKEIALYVVSKPHYIFQHVESKQFNIHTFLSYQDLYFNLFNSSIFHPPKQTDFIG